MLFITLALALTADRASTPAQDLGWRRYSNVRYGYNTCYPSRLMTPSPAVAAGDGRTFRSRSGAELRVWGKYQLDGIYSVADEVASLKSELAAVGGTITYQRSRDNWTVISGRSPKQVFWAKVAQRDDRIVAVELVHPVAELRQYSTVASALNACSTIGTAPF